MNDIKFFELKKESFMWTKIYKLDVAKRKQYITEYINNEEKLTESEMDSVSFAEKIQTIRKNIEKLDESYINTNIIDGTKIYIKVTYKDNTEKNIICKNKFPDEVKQITNSLNI